jgi:hypothetical protein
MIIDNSLLPFALLEEEDWFEMTLWRWRAVIRPSLAKRCFHDDANVSWWREL